jgi:hypothetical protein
MSCGHGWMLVAASIAAVLPAWQAYSVDQLHVLPHTLTDTTAFTASTDVSRRCMYMCMCAWHGADSRDVSVVSV